MAWLPGAAWDGLGMLWLWPEATWVARVAWGGLGYLGMTCGALGLFGVGWGTPGVFLGPWVLQGVPRALPVGSWGALGVLLRCSWHLGCSWGIPGVILRYSWTLLGAPWVLPGWSWDRFGWGGQETGGCQGGVKSDKCLVKRATKSACN